MLAVLRIKNFAIVEEIEIEFGPGMNVLTGETGAGKSIILKSIELISGKRASGEIIRQGATSCEIEALFILNARSKKAIQEIDEDLFASISEDELLIRRVVDQTARSKIYINGKLSTAGILQHIASALIDITSQHDQQSLLKTEQHLEMLDAFGVEESLLEKVESAFSDFSKKRKVYEKFKEDSKEKQLHLTRLEAEKEELSQAGLKANEREELEGEIKRLSSVEQLAELLQSARALLEDEDSLAKALGKVELELKQAARLDPKLEQTSMLVESANLQISEAALSISRYLSSLNAEPEQLERTRERIGEIAKLERKYKKTASELVNYLAKIEEELALYQDSDASAAKLEKAMKESALALKELEKELSQKRLEISKELCSAVEAGLSSLMMKDARFHVRLEAKDSSAKGADFVEFLLAANPGEPAQALSKVASGGELSRILLVLKIALRQKNIPTSQIFDEVDTGISGAVSEIVGEKLKQLSRLSQVILVTHSPQVAALADQHFFISKKSEEEKTRTRVEKLSQDERVLKIAKMLAGKNLSEEFKNSAKKLLKLS